MKTSTRGRGSIPGVSAYSPKTSRKKHPSFERFTFKKQTLIGVRPRYYIMQIDIHYYATYLDKKLDSFFRMFGFQGGLWTNVRRSIISSGAETASGALWGMAPWPPCPTSPILNGALNMNTRPKYSSTTMQTHFLKHAENCTKCFKGLYHFYQAASLHRHTLLRELLPKHKLIVV